MPLCRKVIFWAHVCIFQLMQHVLMQKRVICSKRKIVSFEFKIWKYALPTNFSNISAAWKLFHIASSDQSANKLRIWLRLENLCIFKLLWTRGIKGQAVSYHSNVNCIVEMLKSCTESILYCTSLINRFAFLQTTHREQVLHCHSFSCFVFSLIL